MSNILRPWQILLTAAAGWVNRDQQAIIEYLREENRVLREHLGSQRLVFAICRQAYSRVGESWGKTAWGLATASVT